MLCACVTNAVHHDSLRSNICLRFRPEVVACACIYTATRLGGIPMPDQWWELFDAPLLGMQTQSAITGLVDAQLPLTPFVQHWIEIEEIAGVIFSLYSRQQRPEYLPLTTMPIEQQQQQQQQQQQR
jgi:hypothetical protein